MTLKNRQFFQEKIRVTPLVAAPGDTHPSDAPAYTARPLTQDHAGYRTVCLITPQLSMVLIPLPAKGWPG